MDRNARNGNTAQYPIEHRYKQASIHMHSCEEREIEGERHGCLGIHLQIMFAFENKPKKTRTNKNKLK